MMTRKANIKYGVTRNFKIVNSLPTFLNSHEVTEIFKLELKSEQPFSDNFEYDFYEVTTRFIECGDILEDIDYFCIKQDFDEEMEE